jgi:hypothetical protein
MAQTSSKATMAFSASPATGPSNDLEAAMPPLLNLTSATDAARWVLPLIPASESCRR